MSCAECWRGLPQLLGRRAPSSVQRQDQQSNGLHEHLGDQFEVDFEQHLRRRSRLLELTYSAAGALGGLVGCVAVVHMPAVGAIVGGAGGYALANQRGSCEQRKHSSWAMQKHCVAEDRMPTLRRLKYLTKWAHKQLIDRAAACPAMRYRILDEVASEFLPWVHKLHSVRPGDGLNRLEMLQYLMPLHMFLRRRIVRQELLSAASSVSAPYDNITMDRFRILFPIVLDTIHEIDRLESEAFEGLLSRVSRRRGTFDAQERQELEQIAHSLQRLLERHDVGAALQAATIATSLPTPQRFSPVAASSHQVDHGQKFDRAPSDCASDGAEFLSCSEDEGDMRSEGVLVLHARAASVPASSSGSTSGGVPIAERLRQYPMSKGPHTWRPWPEDTFRLRSQSYFQNRVKGPSPPAMFESVQLEIVHVGPDGPAWRVAKHKDFFVQHRRRLGDKRFFVVCNWVYPPYQSIQISALNPDAPWQRDPSSPQAVLWKRFIELPPEEQADRFKVVMSVEDGPFLVKHLCPLKPVLMGRKVNITPHHEPGDHFEFVMDIATSKTDQTIVSVVMSQMKRLRISLALMIESREYDELPESLIHCCHGEYMDPSLMGYPCTDPDWQGDHVKPLARQCS